MMPKRPKMQRPGCGAFEDEFGLSQAEFAQRIGIPVATVRGWEQGKLLPQGAARALLRVIDRVPEAVLALSAG